MLTREEHAQDTIHLEGYGTQALQGAWVKPLDPRALELLNAGELPEDCALGAKGDSDGVMPIGKAQRESLYDALRRVRDTRDDNKSFPIGGMLSIVVMAMMSGATSVKAIARFAERPRQLPAVQGRTHVRLASCLPNGGQADVKLNHHAYSVHFLFDKLGSSAY